MRQNLEPWPPAVPLCQMTHIWWPLGPTCLCAMGLQELLQGWPPSSNSARLLLSDLHPFIPELLVSAYYVLALHSCTYWTGQPRACPTGPV